MVAKEILIDQRRQAIKLEQAVLKRGGGEKQLFATLSCPSDRLPKPIALPVGVPQFVGLVDYHEVPFDRTHLVL